jgi:hypothetical protein
MPGCALRFSLVIGGTRFRRYEIGHRPSRIDSIHLHVRNPACAARCYNRTMNIRVVSPVRGEVVEVTPDGVEVIAEAPLQPGQRCWILMKKDFQARRLQGCIRWCIARPFLEVPAQTAAFAHHFFLEAREMDPEVLRFLKRKVATA